MHTVVYHSNDHKKINGTLFYCFEYFALIKKFVPDVKYILFNTTDEDLDWFKSIFIEKYNFDHTWLDDVINIKPGNRTRFMQLGVSNILILDTHTYDKVKDFTGNVKNVRVYAESVKWLPKLNDKHVFYGFYDEYQIYHIKNPIKVYADIHKTFKKKGDKIFVTALNCDNDHIINKLGLDRSRVFVKDLNKHNKNMWEQIYKMIYWHGDDTDTNNRAIVEAYIHNIQLEVHLNGYYKDSIWHRYNLMLDDNMDEVLLNENDRLVQDFIHDCLHT
jgi:hypothetical protein